MLVLSLVAAGLMIAFDPKATELFTVDGEPAFEVALYFAVHTTAHVGNGGVEPTNSAGRAINTALIMFSLQLFMLITCEITAQCIAMPHTRVARQKRMPVLVSLSTGKERIHTFLRGIIGLSCVMLCISLGGASVAYGVTPDAFCENGNDNRCSFLLAWYWALNTLCMTGQHEPAPGLISAGGRLVSILFILLFMPLYPLAIGIMCGKLIDEHQSQTVRTAPRSNSVAKSRPASQRSDTSFASVPPLDTSFTSSTPMADSSI